MQVHIWEKCYYILLVIKLTKFYVTIAAQWAVKGAALEDSRWTSRWWRRPT